MILQSLLIDANRVDLTMVRVNLLYKVREARTGGRGKALRRTVVRNERSIKIRDSSFYAKYI